MPAENRRALSVVQLGLQILLDERDPGKVDSITRGGNHQFAGIITTSLGVCFDRSSAVSPDSRSEVVAFVGAPLPSFQTCFADGSGRIRGRRAGSQQTTTPRGVVNAAGPVREFRIGLPVRVAILAAAVIAEKIFLNRFVDFERAESAQGLGAVLRVAQHWGFRFFVALTAALALFAYVRGGQGVRAAQAALRAAPLRFGWMLVHLLLIAVLALLSFVLYRYTPNDLALAGVVALWIVVGCTAVLAALLAMAPGPLWRDAVRALGPIWWYAAVAALLGTAAVQLTQLLWDPTAALTFDLVSRLLTPVLPALTADPAARVLSTGRFAVQISDGCSGLEGGGLMLAFSGAWLLYFRHEYIFPRALLLIPASIAAIFGLNVVRLAAL